MYNLLYLVKDILNLNKIFFTIAGGVKLLRKIS